MCFKTEPTPLVTLLYTTTLFGLFRLMEAAGFVRGLFELCPRNFPERGSCWSLPTTPWSGPLVLLRPRQLMVRLRMRIQDLKT
jgi:hypothetical protein